jgi:catechol 2,3-dioxygenase-like lactoylglutathione lyase family enzyme
MPVTIPVLPVPDLDRAAEFYRRLGFVEDGRWGDYLILVHPTGVELHFHLEGRWGHGGGVHSGEAYIRFDSAAETDHLHRAWAAAAEGSVSEPHETFYGLLEFGLDDPFGNRIKVGGPSASAQVG